MNILGLPDEILYTGTSAEVFAHYGLTGAGIAASVLEGIRK
jgi:transketolase C-terminal domain/subunit